MPTLGKMLADQARVFADFPTETITIGGTDYQCLVMDQAKGNDYGEGGLVSDVRFRVAIERSKMDSAIPIRGILATFNSTSFRIGEVEQDDTAASVILNLENPTIR